jgi:hypothetical protein
MIGLALYPGRHYRARNGSGFDKGQMPVHDSVTQKFVWDRHLAGQLIGRMPVPHEARSRIVNNCLV